MDFRFKVEIVKASGVTCDARTWWRANQAKTPSVFVKQLLVRVFDTMTLLTSTQKGGGSSNKVHEGAEAHRKPLDARKLSAIYSKSYFKITYK